MEQTYSKRKFRLGGISLIKCVICRREMIGMGHNASPLAEGRCCNECNGLVIMSRLARVQNGS